MRRILPIVLFIMISFQINAQSWISLKETAEVKVFYKLKNDKEGNEEIRIKLINQSKSNLNVDLEIGFYDAGVMNQRTAIADCLRKGFFNNVFRVWQVIRAEDGMETKLSEMEVQLTELKTEKVDHCEVTEH